MSCISLSALSLSTLLAYSHTHAEPSRRWQWLTISQVFRQTAVQSCTREHAVPAAMYLCCHNATINAGCCQQQEAIAIKGRDTPALAGASDCNCLVLNLTCPQNNARFNSTWSLRFCDAACVYIAYAFPMAGGMPSCSKGQPQLNVINAGERHALHLCLVLTKMLSTHELLMLPSSSFLSQWAVHLTLLCQCRT